MADQKCIVDVPLIAKKAKETGQEDVYITEVELPDGTKFDLQVYIFGTPREEIQAGATCNGVCW